MDEVYIEELKRYLVESPAEFKFRCNDAAARDLRRALFRSASLNGQYISMFFPELGSDSQSVVDGMTEITSDQSSRDNSPGSDVMQDAPSRKKRMVTTRNWILNDVSRDPANVDPSHPGRPCVRKFRKGEPTYRCLYVLTTNFFFLPPH
jgi:E3 ubiquitin-protein ligase UBR1